MLEIVAKNAYHADRVDFAGAAREVAASTSMADVHGVALHVLAELGDHHSFFLDVAANESESAEQSAPVSSTRAAATDLGAGIGLLDVLPVEALMPSERADSYFSAERAALGASSACGWIVDLRGDYGGSLPPMLEAVAPLLGPGATVSYRERDGHLDVFSVSDDLHVVQPGAPTATTAVVESPDISQVPVAVLTDAATGSAGEGVTMAFIGRAHTRSFGQPTAGKPTANVIFQLSDGSALALTVAIGVDRTGVTHEGPIIPDVMTPKQTGRTDSTREAAEHWLLQQPACIGTNSSTDTTPR